MADPSPEMTAPPTSQPTTTEKKVAAVDQTSTTSPSSSSHDGKEKTPIAAGHVDAIVEGTVTKDGIKVHPQPTTDPLDPLNWPKWRKHSILAIVMVK